MKKIFLVFSLLLMSINSYSLPRVLTIGDSITAGVNSTTGLGYRKQFQDSAGIGTYDMVGQYSYPESDETYDVNSYSVAGWKTESMENALQYNLNNFMPTPNDPGSVAIIWGGVNDLFGIPTWSIGGAVDNIEDMVNIIDAHDQTIDVYVTLITPGPEETVEFNTALEERINSMEKTNLYLVDMYTTFMNDPGYPGILPNTHPNDDGYIVAGQAYYNAIISEKVGDTSVTLCDFIGSDFTIQ